MLVFLPFNPNRLPYPIKTRSSDLGTLVLLAQTDVFLNRIPTHYQSILPFPL